MSHTIHAYWPPSTNTYWRHLSKGKLAGRTLISEKGRQYRKDIADLAMVNRWPTFGDSRLSVAIRADPPDKRKRDLDNILKATLDALTHAGVWTDDGQIDQLAIFRGEPCSGGQLEISIEVMND